MRFDETDKKILRLLQADGRMTMKSLGEAVHLSPPATVERVRRLESEGVITGYRACVEPRAVELQVCATIVLTFRPGEKENFLAYLPGEKAIFQAYATPGKSNAVLEIACRDMQSFTDLLGRIQQFGATDSFLHLNTYKQDCLPFQ